MSRPTRAKVAIPKSKARPGGRVIERGDPVYDPPREEDVEFKAAWAARLERGVKPVTTESVLREWHRHSDACLGPLAVNGSRFCSKLHTTVAPNGDGSFS